MQYTNNDIDNKLRQLEKQAIPDMKQLENHWADMKLLLVPAISPVSNAGNFFKNPLRLIITIGITSAVLFAVYKFSKTSNPKNVPAVQPALAVGKSPEKDTVPRQSATIATDTVPSLFSVPKRSTKYVPAKRKSVLADTALFDKQLKNYDTINTSPTSKTFTTRKVSTKTSKVPTGNTIRLVPMKRAISTKPVSIKTATVIRKEAEPVILTANATIKNNDSIRFIPPTIKTKKDTLRIQFQNAVPVIKTDSANIILVKDTGQFSSLEEILRLPYFKNKIVYVDLWGTRCGPCINEFPHMGSLKEKYKEQPLIFLYLKSPYGFDDSKEWKEMVYKYNLTGIHVPMSVQFYSNNFWNKYAGHYPEQRLFGIPTYLIIDKSGRIIDFDAPRPSETKALYKLLDKEVGTVL